MRINLLLIQLIKPCMAILFAAGTLLMASNSYASVILGQIWQNVPASGANAGHVPAGAPDALFTTTLIDYNSANGYTPAGFLNHPTFTSPSATFNANGSLDDTFIRLTGQTFLSAGNNSFVLL